ncbi:Pimeloyl-ACP methyl ester carboxylesterase [Glycomyces sambucus]|uniref:Pimeloyl-ACP methyl ester carboxylesterase n=1 Tax=Glycomyces sambucus TaxID=380244 RepID=A0A1G9M544_9ACTN|nr:alpha/beta fold hydrolase [Glycomyces sambucus]SDL69422.1 Pimeloyl-ACP methyl ester carboxylesterase [Glycomyces sambucus]
MTNISSGIAHPILLSTSVTGSGPGVVLAHGASGSIESNFGSLIPLLAQGHTVTASGYPTDDTPLDLDGLADALVAAAATERFTIVGFSLGTAVAVRAAVRHPDRVAGLVLAAGIARADHRLRLAFDLWTALLRAGDRDAFARLAMYAAFSASFTNGLAPEAVAASVDMIAARVHDGILPQAALGRAADTTADLARVAVPTLVIAATEDLLVDPANHRFLAERIPGAEYTEIAAGHVLMAERPDEWHRAVLEFLDRKGL